MALTQSIALANGIKMPVLGLGVWRSCVGEETERAVTWALKAGYRHIDTAMVYENEESVGKAIASAGVPREEVFVTTKLWNSDQGYESTLKAFDRSLTLLGLDYVDLYLIHWPGRGNFIETWRAFEKLYSDKKVRAIGVSNFQTRHIDSLLKQCTVRPMVNQIEIHPLNSQKELCQYCKDRNIAVTAWSPLGQGNLVSDSLLQAIGNKYGKTSAQVMLRWEVQNGLITIPKSVNEARIKENANIFDFELKPEDMQAIDSMNCNRRFGPHPDHFFVDFA
ncbi:putative Aldo keto reductase family [Trypanosoma vivax]|uniref:9,11-endoperoxide prostaglandin H2 reductase n=1 Tax=Trypanosoma vivax (strain Y486) TaxID=1055687 RepID=G0UB08_TRYVY|nr:putative prostaglandin f synthase [Trypanosoma vivax]KAH8611161.1 putative Aldo keto reductase family [Trypanosoma vivax]CCC52995.1 putative prostaglandin f synthase [Trypanosoma vivax Y486]